MELASSKGNDLLAIIVILQADTSSQAYHLAKAISLPEGKVVFFNSRRLMELFLNGVVSV